MEWDKKIPLGRLGKQRPQYHLPELSQINRSARFNRVGGQTPVTSSRATGQARRTQRSCTFAGPGDDGSTKVLGHAGSQISAFPYLTLIDRCFSFAVVSWQRKRIIPLCVLCASSVAGGEIGRSKFAFAIAPTMPK
jgi:hypothetical protein